MDRSQRAYERILLPLCFSAGFKPILGTYSEKKVSDWVKTFDNTYELKKKSKESKGETESRRVLEKIFDKPFSKSRPKFLFNPATGKSLESVMANYKKVLVLDESMFGGLSSFCLKALNNR